ncbi:hypothetical protein EYF80_037779 [Liparis tanakae]|uniref:Uncharacterized protein n=1 Tax=Liparis tanakae TaxID=230148 RepID=A0A4Z2GFS8_9TELE|nr:hypothetical protein EYF80_037779 [Liparis tanakae]
MQTDSQSEGPEYQRQLGERLSGEICVQYGRSQGGIRDELGNGALERGTQFDTWTKPEFIFTHSDASFNLQ